jgi:hypothetical protein
MSNSESDAECPLLGVKQTWLPHRKMSAIIQFNAARRILTAVSVLSPASSTEVDNDPHEFSCHRCSCRCVFRTTAGSGLPGSLVRGDPIRPRQYVLGLPVSLVRRLLPQRQYFGRQSRLLQCEPVLCRQRCRRHAHSETPRTPAVAAAPDMSLMSACALHMSAFDPKRTSQTILVSASFSSLGCPRLVPQRAIYFAPRWRENRRDRGARRLTISGNLRWLKITGSVRSSWGWRCPFVALSGHRLMRCKCQTNPQSAGARDARPLLAFIRSRLCPK